MKQIATAALILNLGAAGVYAQGPVAFSGTANPSPIVLKTGANTTEYNFTGNGALGSFTFQTLSASAPSSPPPSGCAFYGSVVAGGGVFRFSDGSLLMVNSAQGTDCIEITPAGPRAHCVRVFKTAGGTGRFSRVLPGGNITLDETLVPAFGDEAGKPVFFAVTGTGTVSILTSD